MTPNPDPQDKTHDEHIKALRKRIEITKRLIAENARTELQYLAKKAAAKEKLHIDVKSGSDK